MAEKANRTFLSDLVDPQVLADMVSGKVDKYIRITPFAKIDYTLQGRPGSTITVPFYGHIGNAVVVAEGEQIPVEALSTSTKDYKVQKIGKGVTITDEAVLSGYGDPVNEAGRQLAQSIAQKIDQDGIDELYKGDQHFIASTTLKYDAVVDGIGVFNEEWNSPKVMFINPAQMTALRKDPNFISADKYGAGTNVMMYGEIGMIANTRIVTSKRVRKNTADVYYPVASGTSGATKVTSENLATVTAGAINGYTPKENDYVMKIDANTMYITPVIRLVSEDEVETGIPAITIYMKRDTFVEPEREAGKKQTSYYADKHYTAALTNAAEVVLLYTKA